MLLDILHISQVHGSKDSLSTGQLEALNALTSLRRHSAHSARLPLVDTVIAYFKETRK